MGPFGSQHNSFIEWYYQCHDLNPILKEILSLKGKMSIYGHVEINDQSICLYHLIASMLIITMSKNVQSVTDNIEDIKLFRQLFLIWAWLGWCIEVLIGPCDSWCMCFIERYYQCHDLKPILKEVWEILWFPLFGQ
jgi:hypothetical protein